MRPEDIFDDLDTPDYPTVSPEDITMPSAVMARDPAKLHRWDKRLVVDVCLGTDEDAILDEYDLTAHQFAVICADPAFQTAVKRMQDELQDEGASFRLKCKLQAEAMLEENWRLAHSEGTDPRVKATIIANTVRWAGWDNNAAKGEAGGNFQISINLGAAEKDVAGVTYDNEG